MAPPTHRGDKRTSVDLRAVHDRLPDVLAEIDASSGSTFLVWTAIISRIDD